ncbi:MAG: DUF222 domain-containing protein [Acidimicrobiia bacterium]
MPDGLLALARALRAALVAFDARLYAGEDAAVVAEELAATVKACAAAQVLATARAAACGAHRQKGFADAADWLARAAGTSTGEARTQLETALALGEMPDTRAAVTAGELSLAQASEVVKTEAACPGSEAELLAVAKGGSLKVLRDASRKRRLKAIDPEDLHRRQHAARSFSHWLDELGMVGFKGLLPPEVGLPFVNRLDAETDRLRGQAKRDNTQEGGEGDCEGRDAYAADALMKLVAGGGKGRAHSADVVIVCDLRAFRRGHAHPGEPVHLVGGGPVPVSVVKELAGDAFLKAVVHDGTRIETVIHYGRHIKAEVRTALELGAPPDFDGVTCAAAGCDRRYHTEWDHKDPKANWGPTAFDNFQALCYPHHQDKTARDRNAGLLSPREPGPDPP